jgi:hypothetical protein
MNQTAEEERLVEEQREQSKRAYADFFNKKVAENRSNIENGYYSNNSEIYPFNTKCALQTCLCEQGTCLFKHLNERHLYHIDTDPCNSKFDSLDIATTIIKNVHNELYCPAMKEIVLTYPYEVGYMYTDPKFRKPRTRTSSVCVAFRQRGPYFNCVTLFPCDKGYLSNSAPFSVELTNQQIITVEAYRLSDKFVPTVCESYVDLTLPTNVSTTHVFPVEYFKRCC